MTTTIARSISPESIEKEEEPKGCLVLKTQLCGKKNCGCRRVGRRHGPYAHLVKYIQIEKREEDKKHIEYQWIYLGRLGKPTTMERLKEATSGTGFQTQMTTVTTRFEEDAEFRKKIMGRTKTHL